MGVDIRQAVTLSDFRALHALIVRMAIRDAEQTRAAGFPSEAVYDAYYRDSPAERHATLTGPGATMLLAQDGGTLLGCLGCTIYAPGLAELEKFDVLQAARGRGIGWQLIDTLLVHTVVQGTRRACLETAFFVTDALALYHRAGFRPCAPFRPPPPGLEGLSVFLDQAL